MQIACTDVDESWYLQLTDDGGCTVSARPMPVVATLRGPAAGLLLALMGRQAFDEVGVDLDGDPKSSSRAATNSSRELELRPTY